MNKVQQLKGYMEVVLRDDITDLRTIPVMESLANVGLGIVMILTAAFHLGLSLWQLAVAILLVGYDVLAKGLTWLLSPHIKRQVPAKMP